MAHTHTKIISLKWNIWPTDTQTYDSSKSVSVKLECISILSVAPCCDSTMISQAHMHFSAPLAPAGLQIWGTVTFALKCKPNRVKICYRGKIKKN